MQDELRARFRTRFIDTARGRVKKSVGLLSDARRDDAMAGAAAYLQPSAMESFSRTVLEALAGVVDQ